jgi:hypothetical protein
MSYGIVISGPADAIKRALDEVAARYGGAANRDMERVHAFLKDAVDELGDGFHAIVEASGHVGNGMVSHTIRVVTHPAPPSVETPVSADTAPADPPPADPPGDPAPPAG